MDCEKLGFLAIDNGDYQEAINIFQRAREKKKTANGYFGFGVANYGLEDYPTARWAFYKALELEPDNEEIKRFIFSVEQKIQQYQKQSSIAHMQSLFRVGKDYLEHYANGKWNKFFVKGINIGLGLPGYFPGEYAIKKGTYIKWFKQIAEIGINCIRIYTIHPPSFYEALYQYNMSSEKKLYLFQGIWIELPHDSNFDDGQYIAYVEKNIKDATDVIYGNIILPEKPGYPHGKYKYDISIYTIAYLFGREWESCAVNKFNELKGRVSKDYRGEFFSIRRGTPFELWITRICDFFQTNEYNTYKISRPLSIINWPTLDSLHHPSESNHEQELKTQGIRFISEICNENEDMESMDVSMIIQEKGPRLFATYHIYPYYPDFMNNDYLNKSNPYLFYLQEVKQHHGEQPVLIAEFGVPSSREITHWQKNGWHHGGHNESQQGKINELLMTSIRAANMAGGILFSWFDEWFKRNWLFLPYEIPTERNPLWFNIQDAEQNYGLLATYPTYPRKKVTLTGCKDDWSTAIILYEKNAELPSFTFHDGFDEARILKRLSVQHDEGFLYILLETEGSIDFEKAHYVIGLNTCGAESGELQFPFNIKLSSPLGLQFLIHLAGKQKSRILICHSYDKYLNVETHEIKPELSDQGMWVIMQSKANTRRISKDQKRFYPSRVFSMSNLRFGSLSNTSSYYNSISDFFFTENRIELRIPWGLINFTDPSSKLVLWKDKDGSTKKTDGIKIIALSYKPHEGCFLSKNTGLKTNATDSLPMNFSSEHIKTYFWEEWDIPIYHTYLKESYHRYKELLSRISEAV